MGTREISSGPNLVVVYSKPRGVSSYSIYRVAVSLRRMGTSALAPRNNGCMYLGPFERRDGSGKSLTAQYEGNLVHQRLHFLGASILGSELAELRQ